MSSATSIRLASAGLRAVAGEPAAELRGTRLEIRGRSISVAVPYLTQDPATLTVAQQRGISDGLGLRIRHSDHELHLAVSPREPLERYMFEIAEQTRCEALADPSWHGVRANTKAAFDRWTAGAQHDGLTETMVGLLIFTATHMLRARILRQPTGADLDDLIETTRGNLSRLIGHALKPLPDLIDNQAGFAVPAREIARLVAEMIGDAEERRIGLAELSDQSRILIPEDWMADGYDVVDSDRPDMAGGAGNGYRIYSAAHDAEIAGEDLYRPANLRDLRARLEELRSAQMVSPARLAQKLQALFGSWTPDLWRGGAEDGPLDTARLARVVADPTNRLIHRRQVARRSADVIVTFLIDTSGSMKHQRFESVAVLVDTLVRALEMVGMSSEVLGFTTSTWAGGRSRRDWEAAGRPEALATGGAGPGRVADLQHIVYKTAHRTWRQSRFSLAAMLRTDHYREGIDGEALAWAAGRLAARPEERKILVLVSDGLPMETSTATLNPEGFLLDHLRRQWELAVDWLEIGAISLQHDLQPLLQPSITLDLSGPLTVGTYDVLNQLFGR